MPLYANAELEHNFAFSDVNLKVDSFVPFIKDTDGAVNPYLLELVREIVKQLPKKSEIKGGYVIVEDFLSDKANHAVVLSGKIFYTGKIIYRQIHHAEKAAVFLCTAGKKISDWINREMKHGDMLDAYLIDLAGSLLVEAAVDKLAKNIDNYAAAGGIGATNRYSPGYCGWDVAEQQKLFTFFPENFCGVRLTDSSLMLPEKSVSGIIGLGKGVKKHPYTCKHCDKTDCIYYYKKEGAL